LPEQVVHSSTECNFTPGLETVSDFYTINHITQFVMDAWHRFYVLSAAGEIHEYGMTSLSSQSDSSLIPAGVPSLKKYREQSIRY